MEQVTTETWKSVAGYDGHYEVSDMGNIRSVPRVDRIGHPWKGRVLKPGTDSKGYRYVQLCVNASTRIRRVHTLVLEAFVGEKPIGHECAHGNGVRNDNRLLNLSWKTPSQNNLDKRRHGTNGCGEKSPRSKLSEVDARRMHVLRAEGLSQRALAERFRVSRSLVSMILHGKVRAHLGLVTIRKRNSPMTSRVGREFIFK